MQDAYVFVSDVHILPHNTELAERFNSFLDSINHKITRLYILGDLFDYWVGPGHEKQREYRCVLDKLHELTDAGIKLFLVHGNRDFFLDRSVEKITGGQVVGDGITQLIDGRMLHMCHGDSLCKHEKSHLVMQSVLRSRTFRFTYPMRPYSLRVALARNLRTRSRPSNGHKPGQPAKLWQPAVDSLWESGADVIICGHTHTEGRRTMQAGGGERLIYTLGDWSADGSYLWYQNGEFEFRSFG